MFISYSKSRRAVKSSCLMFAGCGGRIANAEHQRQQEQRHINVVYGPPHDRYASFAMLTMFGAMAAEVW
jgi:hypothetical protein